MEIKSRVTRFAGLLCIAGALQGFPVIYSANPGGIISVARQGTYHLTGTIVDGYGEPVIGANVVEKGTTNGTVTDIDGKFSLEVAPDAVLTISFIGYISKEITLKGEKELKVVLVEDTQTLDEVVVVGYGTQKKVNLTGAVEQVTSEVFDNRSVPNVTQALQGSIPNLNIQLTDGKPTRSASYNVRGTTSIGQGGSALVLIDGVEGDPSMLNPNDIASVSVLKDAASAAIYGARGTFGVVLITTKEPTKDKTSITYSGNFAMQKPVTVPDFVTDGYEYASHFYEAYHAWNNYSADPKNINKTQEFSLGWLEDFKRRKEQGITDEVTVDATGKYVYYGNEDYYDALYKKTTFAQDHNLSVTGNNGKLNYYVSGRFYGYDGLFRYNTDNYKMMNLRAKGSVQVFDWLKIENNMDFSNMDYHNPINVGEGGSIWRNISDEGHPTSPIFNPDGSLTFSAAYSVGDFIYGKNGIDTNNKVLKNTTGFTASFLENKLHVRGDFTFRNTDEGQTQRRVPVPYSTHEGQTVELSAKYNDLKESNMRTEYIATNLYADYEDTFGDAHYFKGMVGYNYEQSTYKSTYVQRNGLLLDDSENINLALGDAITTSGGYNRWRVAGGFFRLNYAFKDRYLLEVNGRYDGSSKFPTDQQWAFFPSVSGGWRVSEEAFWKVNPDLFSNLKIRASYGSLGNGNVSPYSFLELLSISTSGRVLNGLKNKYTSAPAVMPDGLTWETATTTDVGLDFGMLNNRLQFNGDYYIRKTTDMYTVGETLPDVFGASSPKGNYADMTTKGWEITLTWRDQFTLAEKPFNYEIRGTLSDYISTIDRYNNQTGNLDDYYAGKRVGEIWGYEANDLFLTNQEVDEYLRGVDMSFFKPNKDWQRGDLKYIDSNGDGKIDPGSGTLKDHGDLKIIGNTTPRYSFGLNLHAGYKGFEVSALFQGVMKRDFPMAASTYLFSGDSNFFKEHLDYYNVYNPGAYLPRLTKPDSPEYNANVGYNTSRYLLNAAYMRLKNLMISYNFQPKLVKKMGLENLKVYFTCDNLFTIDNLPDVFDPETLNQVNTWAGGSNETAPGLTSPMKQNGNGKVYPLNKNYVFGIEFTF